MKHTHQRDTVIQFSEMPSVLAAVAYHTCSNCLIFHLGDGVEDFFTMAAIVSVLLLGGARVESLLSVV